MVSTREALKSPPGEAPRRSARERTAVRVSPRLEQKPHKKTTKPTKSSLRVKEIQRLAQKEKAKSPKLLVDPVSGETVWVAPATKATLQLAARKHRPPWLQSKRYLVTLANVKDRQDVYDRAARALAELETRVLPTYGNRPWQCIVTLKEPVLSGKKATATTPTSPYFCWDPRGRLELATFPHLMDKMPTPPHFPGYQIPASTTHKRRQRNPTLTARAAAVSEPVEPATADPTSEPADPSVVPISAAEPSDEEGDSEEEEELSEELLDLRELQERTVSGLSKLAWELKWRVPVPTIHYKWISPLRQSFTTRKSAWEHAVQLCQHEVLLDRVLTGYGAHGKPIKLAPQPRGAVLKAGKLRFERDGLWIVGQEEEWGRERILTLSNDGTDTGDVVSSINAASHTPTTPSNAEPTVAVATQSRRLSGLAYYIQRHRKEHHQKRIRELQALSVAPRTVNVPMEDTMPVESNTPPLPTTAVLEVVRVDYIASRQPTMVMLETIASPPLPATLPMKKEVRLDAIATSPLQTTPSEETMPAESLASPLPPSMKESMLVKSVTSSLPTVPFIPAKPTRVVFSMRDAEKELRCMWKSLPEQERQQWIEIARVEQAKLDAEGKETLPFVPGAFACTPKSAVSDDATSNAVSLAASSSMVEDLEMAQCFPSSALSLMYGDKVSIVSASPSPPVGPDAIRVTETPEHAQRVALQVPVVSPLATSSVPGRKPSAQVAERKQQPVSSPLAKLQSDFSRSRKWCLNDEQIKKCYSSGMEHYDQILRTVSARDLTRELEDGFDLLRERGKGRWDMNLPEWDAPEYGFLNDTKKSPWMPVVKEILGKDVVLIHKGMFLSMPGSSKQAYHQDGPHLTTQYQKPCHAINVFVPVVDLTLENGPTEFCLGSHILGHEELDDDFLHTPTVEAGTPIIFDYRLGHRGLANTSTSCRPIVYCTYAAAADGKEFRDSVNFSRKRYHRIGDLVEKGMTREQRAEKRMRSVEEQQIEDALAASCAMLRQNDLQSPPCKKARQSHDLVSKQGQNSEFHTPRTQQVPSPPDETATVVGTSAYLLA